MDRRGVGHDEEARPRFEELDHVLQPHRGSLILVFGILSLVMCAPLGPVAWYLGTQDLKAMNAGTMDPLGRDTTQAGRICGIIGTVFLILGCGLAIVYIGTILLFLGVAVAGAGN